MADFTDLIVRLQRATAPDRKLDVEIGRMQGVLVNLQDRETGALYEHTYHRYTESIDSALTLVPQGQTWNLGQWYSKSGDGQIVHWFDLHCREEQQARHHVAAMAICIAALRARQDEPAIQGK